MRRQQQAPLHVALLSLLFAILLTLSDSLTAPATAIVRTPPIVFPDCACDRNRQNSPYRVIAGDTYKNKYGGYTYCYKVLVVDCINKKSECCDVALDKIELPMALECKGSLIALEYQGRNWTQSYATAIPEQQRQTLKFLRLDLAPASANQAKFCLTLGGACPLINQFCWPPEKGQCEFAVFNPAPRQCCPLSKTLAPKQPPAPFPSPPPPPPPPACLTYISFIRNSGGVDTDTCVLLAAIARPRYAPDGDMSYFSCAGVSSTMSNVSAFGSFKAVQQAFVNFADPARTALTYAQFRLTHSKNTANATAFGTLEAAINTYPIFAQADLAQQSFMYFGMVCGDTMQYQSSCYAPFLWEIEFMVDGACVGSVAYTTVDDMLKAPFFQLNCYKPNSSFMPLLHSPQIEFMVDGACAGSVAYTTVDDMPKAPFFQLQPYVSLKITQIGHTMVNAAGTRETSGSRGPYPGGPGVPGGPGDLIQGVQGVLIQGSRDPRGSREPLSREERSRNLGQLVQHGLFSSGELQICIVMRQNAQCENIWTLCGGRPCTYSIFNKPDEENKCCPVRSWYDDPIVLS
eukprot:gene16989-23262_t